MDWSSKFLMDLKSSKDSRAALHTASISPVVCHVQRWLPLVAGYLKLNVDASVTMGSNRFSVGLILRDHLGEFVARKASCYPGVGSVLEAEVHAIFEGLQWLISMSHNNVIIESDSLLSIQAIEHTSDIQFEEGQVIDLCQEVVASKVGLSLSFVKRQAKGSTI